MEHGRTCPLCHLAAPSTIVDVAYQILLRRDIAANWASVNPVLAYGELGIDTTNAQARIGDGSTPWNLLPLFIRAAGADSIYGSGNDGDLSITSGTTTLTRDMNVANLSISAGATLATAGYRLFVDGTLSGAGTISNTGGAGATAGTAGAAAVSGYYGGGTIGGAGVSAAAGGSGTAAGSNRSVSNAAGGAGGLGASGAGGTGGTQSAVTAAQTGFTPTNLFQGIHPYTLLLGRTMPNSSAGYSFQGGTGGGAGGGDSTGAGGGGGGGGGVCAVFARSCTGWTGTIDASGGAGGNAAGTNRGGGGGGGGGLAAIVTGTTYAGVLRSDGGTGGTKTGTGIAGTAGTTGVTVSIIV